MESRQYNQFDSMTDHTNSKVRSRNSKIIAQSNVNYQKVIDYNFWSRKVFEGINIITLELIILEIKASLEGRRKTLQSGDLILFALVLFFLFHLAD